MSKSEIRVLHLIGGDLGGGAARGAYSLHRGLLANGIHSRVISNSSTNLSDETVFSIAKNVREKLARAVRSRVDVAPTLFYPSREKIIFSTGFAGYDFTKTEAYAEATIIHLHWVNGGFVSMRDLRNINKPIVWTLRDMWPMTGGCHYSMGCENYVANCGKCPQLNSTSKFDLSWIVNASKQKYIPKSIKVVGISHWLSERARESSIFKAHDVRTIFNNIDTQKFSPVEKAIARSILEIRTDKKIILVGAQSHNDFYKGFGKYLEAIRHLDKGNYHLCFFGNINQHLLAGLGFSFSVFGFLHDTISLRLAYSAADVFVAPSLMEAFGKTLAEAMACGTPVVCFDATGPRDIVDHMVNGYRAIPFDPEDIARGIEWVCHHKNSAELARSARGKAITSFDNSIIANQYIELYQDILDHETEI
jgi:glycosyltransferase involved in cell wall biosynthesis